ncbi:MAG: DUF805 domain-containing protein [Bacteroidales bacterium]|nr:DUF805 domain-containing protein [Bacteroidales bacterium]
MKDILAIVKKVFLENYCNFNGRATRAEFWYAFLFNFIVTFILGLFGKVGMYLTAIWSLAVLLPMLGVGARRLHDINKSGWLWLIGLIPLIGEIILIVWWAKAGDTTENQYGPVPTVPTAE